MTYNPLLINRNGNIMAMLLYYYLFRSCNKYNRLSKFSKYQPIICSAYSFLLYIFDILTQPSINDILINKQNILISCTLHNPNHILHIRLFSLYSNLSNRSCNLKLIRKFYMEIDMEDIIDLKSWWHVDNTLHNNPDKNQYRVKYKTCNSFNKECILSMFYHLHTPINIAQHELRKLQD